MIERTAKNDDLCNPIHIKLADGNVVCVNHRYQVSRLLAEGGQTIAPHLAQEEGYGSTVNDGGSDRSDSGHDRRSSRK